MLDLFETNAFTHPGTLKVLGTPIDLSKVTTSQILSAINQSKFDLQPILQGVVDTAARLCRAEQAVIYRPEGGVYRFAAGYSVKPAYLEIERQTAIPPGHGTLVGRAAMTRQVARIDDAWSDPLLREKAPAPIFQTNV